MNRCLNDIFGCCTGSPKEAIKEEEWQVTPSSYNKLGIERKNKTVCRLALQTCGYYKTSKEMPGYNPPEEAKAKKKGGNRGTEKTR